MFLCVCVHACVRVCVCVCVCFGGAVRGGAKGCVKCSLCNDFHFVIKLCACFVLLFYFSILQYMY